MKTKLLVLALVSAVVTGTASAASLTTTFISNSSNNVGLITTTQSGSLANVTGTLTIFSSSTNLLAANVTGVTTLSQFAALLATDPGSVRSVGFTNGALTSSAATEVGASGNRMYVWMQSTDGNSYGAFKGNALVPSVGAISLTSATLGDLGIGTSVYSATGTSGFQLASVPEPSAALLGAIGALGLLRRRRN